MFDRNTNNEDGSFWGYIQCVETLEYKYSDDAVCEYIAVKGKVTVLQKQDQEIYAHYNNREKKSNGSEEDRTGRKWHESSWARNVKIGGGMTSGMMWGGIQLGWRLDS